MFFATRYYAGDPEASSDVHSAIYHQISLLGQIPWDIGKNAGIPSATTATDALLADHNVEQR